MHKFRILIFLWQIFTPCRLTTNCSSFRRESPPTKLLRIRVCSALFTVRNGYYLQKCKLLFSSPLWNGHVPGNQVSILKLCDYDHHSKGTSPLTPRLPPLSNWRHSLPLFWGLRDHQTDQLRSVWVGGGMGEWEGGNFKFCISYIITIYPRRKVFLGRKRNTGDTFAVKVCQFNLSV